MEYSAYTTHLKQQTNTTETENGAITLQSSLNDCVDFFYATLASEQEYYQKFLKALKEDRKTALKILFWHRDIRTTGMGRRSNFRYILSLVDEWGQDNDFTLHSIYEYGRSDDLLNLLDTKRGIEVLRLIKKVLNPASKNEFDDNLLPGTPDQSLLAKWMKYANHPKKKTIVFTQEELLVS